MIAKFILAAAFLLFLSSAAAQNGWQIQTIASGSNNLNDVFFINDCTGWTVGDNGSLFKTTNSGINWTQLQIPADSKLLSVHFISAMTGWICSAEGVVYNTINGGGNWTSKCLLKYDELKSVCFVTPTRGFIAGNSGRIYLTTDGGDVWTAVQTFSKGRLNSICFIDQLTGLAVTEDGFILKTYNCGISWVPKIPQNTPNVKRLGVLFDVNISQTGFGLIGGSYGVVYFTHDFGETWYARGFEPGFNEHILSVFPVNDYVGWAASSGGKIYSTFTVGQDWTYYGAFPQSSFNAVSFTGMLCGCMAGDRGEILSTTTGGFNFNSNGFCICGNPINMPYNGEYCYTILPESAEDSYWTLANEGNTEARIVSDSTAACIRVFSGFSVGGYNLFYRSDHQILTQKYVYVDVPLYHNPVLSFVTNTGRNKDAASSTRREFSLSQNYPNPFNASTKISYELPQSGFVSLNIYDNTGRLVKNLLNEIREESNYTVQFDAGNLASGVYYYVLKSGNYSSTKTMLLIK